jgi:hypothetical protein
MIGWRQAVFIRQRIDVIQRALSKILDEESWSPATPRRLRVGAADASSRGWTMIAPELANFFLDRKGADPGGTHELRLCRLARELRCPAYEVDVRGTSATLIEADALGRVRISGAPMLLASALGGDGDLELDGVGIASATVSFGLVPISDEIRDRIAALCNGPAMALADYLGALAGFPAWTRHGDDAIAAGELIYEPPQTAMRELGRGSGRSFGRGTGTNGLMALPPRTHEASGPATPRAALPANDRRGRRPRSASRPRR